MRRGTITRRAVCHINSHNSNSLAYLILASPGKLYMTPLATRFLTTSSFPFWNLKIYTFAAGFQKKSNKNGFTKSGGESILHEGMREEEPVGEQWYNLFRDKKERRALLVCVL